MNSRSLQNISISQAFPKKQQIVRLHQSRILSTFRALDSCVIIFVLWGALAFFDVTWINTHSILALVAVIVFGLFAEYNDVYHYWRGCSNLSLATEIFASWAQTAILLFACTLALETFSDVYFGAVLMWISVAPGILIAIHISRRIFLIHIRRQAAHPTKVAVVGATQLGKRLVQSFEEVPWLGYHVEGFYEDRVVADDDKRRLSNLSHKVSGDFECLYEDAKNGKIQIAFITLPMRAETRVEELINRLADTTISVYLIPDVFHFNLLHSRITGIQGIPALSIYDSPLVENGWLKRMEDIVLGTAILCLVALPMLAIACGVKLTSPGPVFFKQTRYGMRGERIKVWKFRSMTVCEDGSQISQAQKQDSRVTRFGAFLRRTSLDELPQLFNVLSGSMSIVGPRPHAVAHNEYYRGQIKGYMLRHKVKPGITGLAQVSGFRGETETLDKMSGRIECDLEYIRNWSLTLDIQILWLTIFRGFVSNNAY